MLLSLVISEIDFFPNSHKQLSFLKVTNIPMSLSLRHLDYIFFCSESMSDEQEMISTAPNGDSDFVAVANGESIEPPRVQNLTDTLVRFLYFLDYKHIQNHLRPITYHFFYFLIEMP